MSAPSSAPATVDPIIESAVAPAALDHMRRALAAAEAAALSGEVPVGAVVVHKGEIVAVAHNQR